MGDYLLECSVKLEEEKKGNICEFKKSFDICCSLFFFFSFFQIVQKIWHFFPPGSSLHKAPVPGPGTQ